MPYSQSSSIVIYLVTLGDQRHTVDQLIAVLSVFARVWLSCRCWWLVSSKSCPMTQEACILAIDKVPMRHLTVMQYYKMRFDHYVC